MKVFSELTPSSFFFFSIWPQFKYQHTDKFTYLIEGLLKANQDAAGVKFSEQEEGLTSQHH